MPFAMKKRIFISGLIISLFLLTRIFFGAQASSNAQVLQYQTPTPQPDGRIIYIVKEGDTCLRISLLTGVSTDQIRRLNRLDEACTVAIGQEILLGSGGPAQASATPGPSPTPTPILPTPTPSRSGFAKVCVLLYDDIDGNALRGEAETGIADGSISFANTQGTYSKTGITVNAIDPDTELPVPVCFTDVPEGEYTVSAGVPEGYNPTTALTNTLKVNPGDNSLMSFGAQPSSVVAVTAGNGGRSFPIALIGGILLAVGAVLAFFSYRMNNAPKKMRYK
jgi:hypothetical protein